MKIDRVDMTFSNGGMQASFPQFEGTLDSLTMHYAASQYVTIGIGPFDETSGGVLLLEYGEQGLTVPGIQQGLTVPGIAWIPLNMSKVGRGMVTCAVNKGPARFQGELPLPRTTIASFRVRADKTADMKPIEVTIAIQGGMTASHTLRGESRFVIAEEPDIRDLYQ